MKTSYKEITKNRKWYHGTNENLVSFKARPPTPYNLFFVTVDKDYAKRYGKTIYVLSLSSKVKVFDPSEKKDQQIVVSNFPRVLSEVWFNVYHRNEAVDDFLRVCFLLSPVNVGGTYDRLSYLLNHSDTIYSKSKADILKKDLKEFDSYLKKNGFNRRKAEEDDELGDDQIRSIILNDLHTFGYNAYYSLEEETGGSKNDYVLGLFDISAIDKIGPA